MSFLLSWFLTIYLSCKHRFCLKSWRISLYTLVISFVHFKGPFQCSKSLLVLFIYYKHTQINNCLLEYWGHLEWWEFQLWWDMCRKSLNVLALDQYWLLCLIEFNYKPKSKNIQILSNIQISQGLWTAFVIRPVYYDFCYCLSKKTMRKIFI